MNAHEVLISPVSTERTAMLDEKYNKVVFKVDKKANKYQIKNAVETMYGVKVIKVATMNVAGKKKRRGTVIGKTPSWKKAIVSIHKDDNIDFYATE